LLVTLVIPWDYLKKEFFGYKLPTNAGKYKKCYRAKQIVLKLDKLDTNRLSSNKKGLLQRKDIVYRLKVRKVKIFAKWNVIVFIGTRSL